MLSTWSGWELTAGALGLTLVRTARQLRVALGGPSTSTGVNTIRPSLHEVDRRWLAACPFWFMATAGADGSCDVSPRGDMAGAVLVLDETTIVLPERGGNRRGDGYAHLLENGRVGLVFLIPGRVDTLRINGRATLVQDGPFFDDLAIAGVRPVLALVVHVEKVFYHCVKAFHRSGLWRHEDWTPHRAPSRSEVAAQLSTVLMQPIACEEIA